jgi:hypothetical protein
MSGDELLQQMRDIQPPPEPPWWLLGPGWLWLAAVVALLGVGAWTWWRRRHSRQLARLAARELHSIQRDYRRDRDSRQLAIRLSRWLKQVALLAFPAQGLQRVNGDAWLAFLDQGLHERPFSQGCGRVFGGEVYRARVELDAGAVIALCERWLRVVAPRLRRRTPR